MLSNETRIDVGQPRAFSSGAVFVLHAYALVLVLPVLVSVLAMSLLNFSMLSLLLPFLALGVTACFLPFGFGNAYVASLVRSIVPAARAREAGFIVQLTLWPRIRNGLRAVVEDADDVGFLHLTESALIFQGDCVNLTVPFASVESVQVQNIGLKGLFVYGPRIQLKLSKVPNVTALEFAERASWLLPASRRVSRQLLRELSAKVAVKAEPGPR